MKVNKEVITQTVVTMTEQEFDEIQKKASFEVMKEIAGGDMELMLALTFLTAKLCANVKSKIFNNKEEK